MASVFFICFCFIGIDILVTIDRKITVRDKIIDDLIKENINLKNN